MKKCCIFLFYFLMAPVCFAETSEHILIKSGSGFFVNDEYIVTNAHVVKECSTVTIKGAAIEQEATVEALDTDRDLALLKTSKNASKVAPMRFDIDTVREGDRIFIIGYPGQEGAHGIYKFVEAQIPYLPANLARPAGEFFISDNVEHGNSGGPVFDVYGNIIGVVVAKTSYYSINKKTGEKSNGQRLGVVISLTTLKEFLSAHSVYTQWVGSGSLSIDPYIEEDAKAYIVNIHCRIDTSVP